MFLIRWGCSEAMSGEVGEVRPEIAQLLHAPLLGQQLQPAAANRPTRAALILLPGDLASIDLGGREHWVCGPQPDRTRVPPEGNA